MNRHSLAAAAVAALLTLPAAGQSLAPKTQGAYRWVCGGVGADERRELAAAKARSNVEVLFVSGQRGAYVSGVELTVRSEGAEALRIAADGPYCYLSAPPGAYRLEARLGEARREQRVRVAASGKAPARVVFTFPAEPGEDIAASEEEKRQAREP